MEWAKFGAEVGIGVLKILVDSKTNTELVEASCERDLYKKEVDRLNSRLDQIGRERYSSGNRSVRGNKSGYNKGISSSSNGFSKSSAVDHFTPGKSSGGPKNQRKNLGGQGTHHSSSSQKISSQTSGAFCGSSVNDRKSQLNASSVGSSRGRGNFQNKGRGRGRGNACQ